jgi:hypothetical protein
MRIKKGRSEKVSDPPGLERTPEADDLMRLDDEEEGAEDDPVRVEVEEEEVDQEKESDQELYMVTDDGRKKKLVKIRLGSPEVCLFHQAYTCSPSRYLTRISVLFLLFLLSIVGRIT